MFIRILNSEMELATGCTEPGAVALTAAEAGCALRRAGANTVEEVLVSASVNIIKKRDVGGHPGVLPTRAWITQPPSARWAVNLSTCWRS